MPFTTNINLEVPARGSDPGTWDLPVNGDFTTIDACFGAVTTKALSNVPVALSISEAQANLLRFTGTLTGNIAVTIPAIIKSWYVENLCVTGPTLYVTLGNASGGQIVGLPPGEIVQVTSDGTNIKFINLGRVGQYVDYAGATVPAWVTASTVPPYLHCNGGTFSAVTYPALNAILGTTTLPDSQGRLRANLNGGTGRITTAGSGIDGDTRFSVGGNQTQTLTQANLPSANFTVNIPAGQGSHAHTMNVPWAPGISGTPAGGVISAGGATTFTTDAAVLPALSGTAASGGSGTGHNSMGPTYIGGITMIRAA